MSSVSDLRPTRAWFAVTAVAGVLIALAALWLIEPAPPARLTMASGGKVGAYYAFARRYREQFARERIELEVRETEGSLENLALLAHADSGVDVALVQGGLLRASGGGLETIAHVAHEPVWVFHRADLALTRLRELRGLRVVVGPEGSGTRPVALALLDAAGATPSLQVEALSMRALEGAEALARGEIDAMFLIAAVDAPVVQQLLRDPRVGLLQGVQADALARRFPWLTVVTLPRGVVDLERDLPAEDIRLVAARASIVAREGLHPALVDLLVAAAREVHGAGSWLHEPGHFPHVRDPEYPLNGEAERVLERGPPFLQRYLPFWLAVWIERMAVFAMSALAIVITLARISPVWGWVQRTRVWKRYKQIARIEDAARIGSGRDVAALLAELEEIERDTLGLTVSSRVAPELYTLRVHIDDLRRRLTARVTE
ncbi:MAG: ABC transporter substrate-binding protein [Burkholderiales bacterium]|nr:MAG: ABC transporter substrate-binding protein [Burkholderiales bacterium]